MAEVVKVLVAPPIWKAKRLAVLVADWVLTKVSGIAGEPEAKLAVIVVVAKDTVEEALSNVKEAIELNLQIMTEDRQDIPVERTDQTIVASTRVFVPARATLAIT